MNAVSWERRATVRSLLSHSDLRCIDDRIHWRSQRRATQTSAPLHEYTSRLLHHRGGTRSHSEVDGEMTSRSNVDEMLCTLLFPFLGWRVKPYPTHQPQDLFSQTYPCSNTIWQSLRYYAVITFILSIPPGDAPACAPSAAPSYKDREEWSHEITYADEEREGTRRIREVVGEQWRSRSPCRGSEIATKSRRIREMKADSSRFGGVFAARGTAVVVLRLALAVHRRELARRLDAAGPTSACDLFVPIPVVGGGQVDSSADYSTLFVWLVCCLIDRSLRRLTV